MLTNRVSPSGLKVAPANSSPYRGEGRAGRMQPVQGDVEDLAAAVEAPQEVVARIVLAEDERAPAAADGDVVREVEGIDARRLVDQLQRLLLDPVGPDLPEAVAEAADRVAGLGGAAALRAAEVDGAAVVDAAFDPREPGGALRPALVADEVDRVVVARRSRLARRVREHLVRLVDIDPRHVVRRPPTLGRRQVRVRRPDDREHLEPAAIRERAALHRVLGRDVPVEARREAEVVLRHVEDPAGWVERDRLVREPARASDRLAIRLPAGRHLEDVPVRLLEGDVRRPREVRTASGPLIVSSHVIQCPRASCRPCSSSGCR